jgi:WD40 repeat protein
MNHVLVGDLGGNATVWGIPPATNPEWSFSDPNPGVLAAVYGPESKFVAVAKLSRGTGQWGDGGARLWNVVDGGPVSPPLRHWASVLTVEFDGQGRFVLTASEDGTARTWPLASIDLAPDQMLQVARALSGKRLDSQFKMIAVPADELQALFRQLRDLHPEFFRATPDELAAWQRYKREAGIRRPPTD